MKKEFTVSGENVDTDITLSYKKSNNNLKKISIIDNIESKEPEEENEYKMFMYFVKPGDSVWKIAKKFRVCMQDIISVNNLENPDKINVGDRLYIVR